MADAVTRAGHGTYRIERDGRTVVVYVAGSGDDWWAFCEGRVFRSASAPAGADRRRSGAAASTALTAPMPATVAAVNVAPGDPVRKGDILVVLDAMKMEMPVRADADGRVKAVYVGPGELVQAETVLIELE